MTSHQVASFLKRLLVLPSVFKVIFQDEVQCGGFVKVLSMAPVICFH